MATHQIGHGPESSQAQKGAEIVFSNIRIILLVQSGVDTLLNAASSRPQSAPPVRQTSQQSSMVQSFSPIDVHPRSRKHEPSKSGHIQCRARSRRPFTAATTRSQELKEKLSHGEALYKEFGPHSRVMAHTAVGARRAQSAQALRSIVHDYSPEVMPLMSQLHSRC